MHMKIRLPHIFAIITLVLVFFAGPVCAAINTIPAGGTVFIGEEGLDISGPAAAVAINLGWWASGAVIATTSPDYQISIPDTSNVYISPTEFGSRTGTWYILPGKTAIFNVADPRVALRVEDTTVNVDVTDKWVPTDDEIRFRIDSNLIPISQRTGVSSVPITIKVQDSNGGTFTSLVNSAGIPTSIVDIPVTTTPFYTASIWDTGQRSVYYPGTYTIWAECNVNSMKDNYDQTGKTVSQKVSLQNQDHNPLITGNYPTTAMTQATTPVTTTIKTPAPVTSTPTVAGTPATTITTPVPVIQTENQPPTTTAPMSTPTKTPGFEGIAVGIAMLLAMMMYCRKD